MGTPGTVSGTVEYSTVRIRNNFSHRRCLNFMDKITTKYSF